MHVILSPTAQRDLRRLATEVRERVLVAIRALRDTPRPHGYLLLRDFSPPTWRIRVGDGRVLYEIEDQAAILQRGSRRTSQLP